jgi:hypothetical protein
VAADAQRGGDGTSNHEGRHGSAKDLHNAGGEVVAGRQPVIVREA